MAMLHGGDVSLSGSLLVPMLYGGGVSLSGPLLIYIYIYMVLAEYVHAAWRRCVS